MARRDVPRDGGLLPGCPASQMGSAQLAYLARAGKIPGVTRAGMDIILTGVATRETLAEWIRELSKRFPKGNRKRPEKPAETPEAHDSARPI